ncbi:MAG: Na(+)-translocating NADH-quinone reductase subunit A, partial [Bacteroidetes bacterium]|nr:Na(+)-translocating NADH-quinone reductase subunit A [Bacteroidota bacterium]
MSKNIFSINSKLAFSFLFSTLSLLSFASPIEPSSTTLIFGLFAGLLALVVFIVGLLSDSIIKLLSKKVEGAETTSLFNSFKNYFLGSGQSKKKKSVNGKSISLKEGFDIKLSGNARNDFKKYESNLYAVKPTDFVGLKPIPKMLVKEGATVKAGDALFYDTGFEGVKFVSPVSGKVKEIRRGAKRAITEIIIEADAKNEYKKFNTNVSSREDILNLLAESGTLALFIERPYGIVPSLNHTPKSIHVSCFDTAPLAPNYNEILNRLNKNDFQKGVEVLSKLTDNVHLNITNNTDSSLLDNINGATVNIVNGLHPAGNVGIQIHHISPINKGDIVWTIQPEDVAVIGKLFNEGIYSPKRIVALAGNVLKERNYVETTQGVNIAGLIKDNLKNENSRVISGDPLSGTAVGKDGFLGFYDNQISVIEEGDEYELFGWLIPSYARPSLSPTFPKSKTYDVNTNTHGEKRAFVVTGEYKEVLPMNIYPQFLFKSIIKEDFEEIEGLGIYELIEEDVALCEFVCTSKQPLQQILRTGLDFI